MQLASIKIYAVWCLFEILVHNLNSIIVKSAPPSTPGGQSKISSGFCAFATSIKRARLISSLLQLKHGCRPGLNPA